MDPEAERDFTTFVQARSAALFRTAMALTGHREQAEDLLQTALLNAVRHWPKISAGHPDAYLRRSMYLQTVSWWRRLSHGREVSTDRLPEAGSMMDGAAQVDLRLALTAALGRLGPRQRAVLVLRYLEDLPDTDIADIVGCKPTTVRSQIPRALSRLRELCPELAMTEQETMR